MPFQPDGVNRPGRRRTRERIDRDGKACRRGHVGEWVRVDRKGKPNGWLCAACQAEAQATLWLERWNYIVAAAVKAGSNLKDDSLFPPEMVARQAAERARLLTELRERESETERKRLEELALL